MSWLANQWPGLIVGVLIGIAWEVASFLSVFLTMPRRRFCPRCGVRSKSAAVCWKCSQDGPGLAVKIDGIERGDTVVPLAREMRDKDAERAAFKARMKEMNRGKAG